MQKIKITLPSKTTEKKIDGKWTKEFGHFNGAEKGSFFTRAWAASMLSKDTSSNPAAQAKFDKAVLYYANLYVNECIEKSNNSLSLHPIRMATDLLKIVNLNNSFLMDRLVEETGVTITGYQPHEPEPNTSKVALSNIKKISSGTENRAAKGII